MRKPKTKRGQAARDKRLSLQVCALPSEKAARDLIKLAISYGDVHALDLPLPFGRPIGKVERSEINYLKCEYCEDNAERKEDGTILCRSCGPITEEHTVIVNFRFGSIRDVLTYNKSDHLQCELCEELIGYNRAKIQRYRSTIHDASFHLDCYLTRFLS